MSEIDSEAALEKAIKKLQRVCADRDSNSKCRSSNAKRGCFEEHFNHDLAFSNELDVDDGISETKSNNSLFSPLEKIPVPPSLLGHLTSSLGLEISDEILVNEKIKNNDYIDRPKLSVYLKVFSCLFVCGTAQGAFLSKAQIVPILIREMFDARVFVIVSSMYFSIVGSIMTFIAVRSQRTLSLKAAGKANEKDVLHRSHSHAFLRYLTVFLAVPFAITKINANSKKQTYLFLIFLGFIVWFLFDRTKRGLFAATIISVFLTFIENTFFYNLNDDIKFHWLFFTIFSSSIGFGYIGRRLVRMFSMK